MTYKTEHVNPSAPRSLSDKPLVLDPKGLRNVTRGSPIKRLLDPDQIEGEPVFGIVDKLNEVIDCINKMNELKP